MEHKRVANVILILVAVSCLPFALSCEREFNGILPLYSVNSELKRYPNQRLLDIYKAYFQGYLGPAHSIDNRRATLKSIRSEIDSAQEFGGPLFHHLPPDGRYVRVNLSLVADGTITVEDFVDAFMRSATPIGTAEIQGFKARWDKILPTLEKHKDIIPHFDEDRAYINTLLENGEYVVHHSNEFIQQYNPHYRVIMIDYLRKIVPTQGCGG